MNSVHFVGVSGIGVSAAAKIAIESGLKVSGSADEENEQTEKLKRMGLKFFLGHRKEQVDRPDIVVRSAAVPQNNPEILEARRKGIPVYLYFEYLGMLMAKKRGIAVAGTHGKTTTTALTGVILSNARLRPTIVCGGVMNDFASNSISGDSSYFVSEACENNRSFLLLKKWYSIITNIEPDHLDCYSDINDIKKAFLNFLKTTDQRGFSVVNGDDENIQDLLNATENQEIFTVGTKDNNQYIIRDIRSTGGLYSFSIERDKEVVLNLRLSIPGIFNCINASLSAVLALNVGIEKLIIEETVKAFRGTERRLEYIGKVDENPVFSDYAHHPTEIAFTVAALKEVYPLKKILVVFQPHQYSRTVMLFQEFINELKASDILILTEVYRQRDSDKFVKVVSSRDLFNELKKVINDNVIYIKEKEDIIPFLQESGYEDVVIVFMGAGNIDDVARKYVKETVT